jgi:hypothetical protein
LYLIEASKYKIHFTSEFIGKTKNPLKSRDFLKKIEEKLGPTK